MTLIKLQMLQCQTREARGPENLDLKVYFNSCEFAAFLTCPGETSIQLLSGSSQLITHSGFIRLQSSQDIWFYAKNLNELRKGPTISSVQTSNITERVFKCFDCKFRLTYTFQNS